MNVKFCWLEGYAMVLILAAAVSASASAEGVEKKSVLDVIHGMHRNDDGDMSFLFSGDHRRPECLVNTGFSKKHPLVPPSP